MGCAGYQRQTGHRWYYRFPGSFHALGPTTYRYRTEREARAAIREAWELARLPRGTEVWRAGR